VLSFDAYFHILQFHFTRVLGDLEVFSSVKTWSPCI